MVNIGWGGVKKRAMAQFFFLSVRFRGGSPNAMFLSLWKIKDAPNHRCILYLASVDGDLVLLFTRKQPGKCQQLRKSQRSMNQLRKYQLARMLPRCTSCCCSMSSW
jgi:hypothetical protein